MVTDLSLREAWKVEVSGSAWIREDPSHFIRRRTRGAVPERDFVRRCLFALVTCTMGCGGDVGAGPALTSEGCSPAAINLGVGEATDIAPGVACAVLGGESGDYALAFFDPSSIPVKGRVFGDTFTVTVRSEPAQGRIGRDVARASGERVGTSGRSHLRRERDLDLSLPAARGACVGGLLQEDPVLCRDRPWELGDRFDFPQRLDGEPPPIPAEVVAISGQLVFAMRPSQVPASGEAVAADLASIVDDLQSRTIPFLSSAFGVGHPVTSPESDQLLVFLGEVQSFGSGANRMRAFQDQLSSRAYVEISYNTSVMELGQPFAVLSHELAHAWQFLYSWEQGGTVNPTWGVEGGADFAVQEILRDIAGVGLEDNLDPESVSDPDVVNYLRRMRFVRGDIERGYTDSAHFLRYLHGRARASGLDNRTIIETILRGSLEDWSGRTGDPGGFTAAWRALVGQDWDMADDVLRYALSVALDDRVAPDLFSWPSVLDEWAEGRSGFEPLGTVTPGTTLTSRHAGGSVAYMYVQDPGLGTSLRIESDKPGLRWRIARF